jgi:hypothetical protein
MTRSFPAVFAVTIVTASFTCSDSNLSTPVRLADDFAQAFCHRQFRCCSPVEIGELAGARYSTEAECLEFAKLAARADLAVLDSAVASGHVVIDGAKAAACVAAYEQRVCNTSSLSREAPTVLPNTYQLLAACPGVVVGRVPVGSRCDLAEECMPGTRCWAGGAMATGGACGATGGLGDICNDSSDCNLAAHLYCRQTDFVCARPQAQGQPCTFDFAGGEAVACDREAGLHCDASVLTCRSLPRAGDPCARGACDPDPELALTCNGFTGTCQSAVGRGEACGAAALPPCQFDLACIPNQSDGIGTCGSPPVEGAACTDKCASPAACDVFTRTCKRPGTAPVGAACAGNDECVTLMCQNIGPGSICVRSGRPIVCGSNTVTPGGGMGFAGTSGQGGTFGAAGTTGIAGINGFAGANVGGTLGEGGTTGAGGVTGAAGM